MMKQQTTALACLSMAVAALLAVRPAHAARTPVNVTDWGAICDGASHPIGTTAPYSTMSEDQRHALFHFYAAPTDEVDGLAINQTLYVDRVVALPATPGGACVVNMPVVTSTGAMLIGQGIGATTVRFEVAAGHTVPDYPLFMAGGLQAQRLVPVSAVTFSGFSVDGGWPPDGNHLGSPSPRAGAPGPIAFYFGPNSSHSVLSQVEVYHEYGAAVQVSGTYITVLGNFLHDNWGPTIHVSGTAPQNGAPLSYASHVSITHNILAHNSLQNYPARNANGGYGGLPSLVTGTGPYFVFSPAGPNANCPGATCLGANDGITLDTLTQHGVIAYNTIYGGDILVFSYGYEVNATWYPDQSGNDLIHDNTVIASPSNGVSVDGWPSNVTIVHNHFEAMLSMLNAGFATPPTFEQQLPSGPHSCEVLNGPAQYVTLVDNTCSGGTVTPDYSSYPPSFTGPGAIATPGVAWGTLVFAMASEGLEGGAPLAPHNIVITGNSYTNATEAGNPNRTSIIDFRSKAGVVPDSIQVNSNVFAETRGLPVAPFQYTLNLGQAGTDMTVLGNTPLVGSKGIANVLPGQDYRQGR